MYRPLSEREALESIFEQLERAFGLMHPGSWTKDEKHGIAQGVWNAMHDAQRGMGDLWWPGQEPSAPSSSEAAPRGLEPEATSPPQDPPSATS